MPRPKQTECFAGETAREQPVYLIHPPNQARWHAAQNFSSHETIEIHAGSASWIPALLRRKVIKSKLLSDTVGQRQEERVDRFQVRSIEFLEIGEHNLCARFAGLPQTTSQKRSFAHLASALNENHAIVTGNRRKKVVISRTNNVEGGIERNGTAYRLQLECATILLRVAQRIEYGHYERRIIGRALPFRILKRIQSRRHRIRQRISKIDAHREDAWLSVLLLRSFVRNLYFVGQHLAADRGLRQQRNHRISLAYASLDFARPLHSHKQMTINEDAITIPQ